MTQWCDFVCTILTWWKFCESVFACLNTRMYECKSVGSQYLQLGV